MTTYMAASQSELRQTSLEFPLADRISDTWADASMAASMTQEILYQTKMAFERT